MPKFNAPFDPKILTIYGQNSADGNYEAIDLFRGSIIGEDDKYGVRFLYNPSQVDLSHSLDPSQVPAGVNPPDVNAAQNNITNAGTLTFALLFDRTYELWKDPHALGVVEDVRAFYLLMQMYVDDATAASNPEAIKAPSPIPAYIYFGQGGDTLKNRALTRPLSYHGWISQLNVTYTHWSKNMIPMRCVVNLSVLLITGDANAGAGSPTGGTTPVSPTSANGPAAPQGANTAPGSLKANATGATGGPLLDPNNPSSWIDASAP